jgi:hypothetical protein
MLKYETKKIINVGDLDNLVVETYGKPYSFQQQDGCRDRETECITIPVKHPYDFENNSLEYEINGDEMGVSFSSWLNTTVEEINNQYPEDYEGQNDLWWERNFYPNLDMIVNDLYEKGLIEAGDYLIEIDW